MKIDIVFVSWNRLEFTKESFEALCQNTAWEHVAKLVLADDASQDGTREWLADHEHQAPVPCEWLEAPFGGPVAAVNAYLDLPGGAAAFAKVDNDFMMCPGWLPELLGLLERHPEVDMLGVRPDIGPPQPCPYPGRSVKPAKWVDGNGVWRRRAFEGRTRPAPGHSNGRFGMTEWMGEQHGLRMGWASPDLPVFTLDGLPFEPWLGLSEEYVRHGWQRGWPNTVYPLGARDYWAWFAEASVEAL